MRKGWTEVALEEVLEPVTRFEERNELTSYQFAGAYSYARGIFRGGLKLGSSFNFPKIQCIKAGDIRKNSTMPRSPATLAPRPYFQRKQELATHITWISHPTRTSTEFSRTSKSLL